MILTPHLLTGAVISAKIANPLLALPLALLSHYFLDPFPSSEYSIINIKERRWKAAFFDFSKVFLDIFSGILLILLFSGANPIILAGAFLAMVPDGMTLLSIIFPKNKLMSAHLKLHMGINSIGQLKNKKIFPPWGILSQIIVIATAILLLR